MDVFVVEAVDLKRLTKVIVGHDGKGFGAGWLLDNIVITESDVATEKYLFECDR